LVRAGLPTGDLTTPVRNRLPAVVAISSKSARLRR